MQLKRVIQRKLGFSKHSNFFQVKTSYSGITFLMCILSLRNVYILKIYTKRPIFLIPDMTHSGKKILLPMIGPDQLIILLQMKFTSRKIFLGHLLFFQISFFLVLNFSSGLSMYCNVTIDSVYCIYQKSTIQQNPKNQKIDEPYYRYNKTTQRTLL
jgi:hypothetical protein